MLRHAIRAVPWSLVAVSSVLIVGLMAAVRFDHWTLWPLQGTAVGVLAGAVGWCLDEPAAAVVDPSPRGLAWRTAARGSGIVCLLAAWLLGVRWAWTELFDHAWPVLVQGAVGAAVGAAWVTWRRTRGEATPGRRWATAAIPFTTAWALVRPLEEHLPVFPYAFGGEYGDWHTSTVGWTLVGLVATVLLVQALAGEGRHPTRRGVRASQR